jgi:Fe-S-cluster containining protein
VQRQIPTANAAAITAKLCPACGLCCSGALFGDVELQRGDNAAALQKLGLNIETKGRKLVFAQPCSCLSGDLCTIYASRPNRCRTFECRLLKRAEAGEISLTAALRRVRQTRRLIKSMITILRKLGESTEHLPLNRRCALVLKAPLDLSGDPAILKRRRRLMTQAHELSQLLAGEFLT